jgi:hypothetical protein
VSALVAGYEYEDVESDEEPIDDIIEDAAARLGLGMGLPHADMEGELSLMPPAPDPGPLRLAALQHRLTMAAREARAQESGRGRSRGGRKVGAGKKGGGGEERGDDNEEMMSIQQRYQRLLELRSRSVGMIAVRTGERGDIDRETLVRHHLRTKVNELEERLLKPPALYLQEGQQEEGVEGSPERKRTSAEKMSLWERRKQGRSPGDSGGGSPDREAGASMRSPLSELDASFGETISRGGAGGASIQHLDLSGIDRRRLARARRNHEQVRACVVWVWVWVWVCVCVVSVRETSFKNVSCY